MKSSGFFILISSLVSHQLSVAEIQFSEIQKSDVFNSENLIAQNSIPSMTTEVQAESLGSTESTVASESTKSEIFYICKRDKDVRWLRAFKMENGRCKTHYSKEGYVQVVSSASYFSSCEAVLNTVKKNIEEGQFKCEEKQLSSFVELE